jgi:hypothetical protein
MRSRSPGEASSDYQLRRPRAASGHHHYEADFDRIAAVTGQTCEWVVPAGSAD